MYNYLFLAFAALFFFAWFGFTIKFFCSRICSVQRRVVGIFSYSSPEDYRWIMQGLNSAMFKGFVKSTLPFIISNSNKAKFRQAVEQCDFAILYHTKNRGRINLTNVTDSLYDEELSYMSTCKGRLNVIVVIDDLERNDFEEKHRILQSQPDIAQFARDLILVSSEDKIHQMSINNKLQQIGDIMSNESGIQVRYWEYLSSMIHWLWRTLICGSRQRPGDGLDAPLLV